MYWNVWIYVVIKISALSKFPVGRGKRSRLKRKIVTLLLISGIFTVTFPNSYQVNIINSVLPLASDLLQVGFRCTFSTP